MKSHHQVVHVGGPQYPESHHYNGDQFQNRHAEHAHNHTQNRHLHITEQSIEISDNDIGHYHFYSPFPAITQGDEQSVNQHEYKTDNFSGQKITDKADANQEKDLAARVQERRPMKGLPLNNLFNLCFFHSNASL